MDSNVNFLYHIVNLLVEKAYTEQYKFRGHHYFVAKTVLKSNDDVLYNLISIKNSLSNDDPLFVKVLVILAEFISDVATSFIKDGKFTFNYFALLPISIKVIRLIRQLKDLEK